MVTLEWLQNSMQPFQCGILVEPSFAVGPMEIRDLDQDGLSQDMQDGCSQQCDFPSIRTLN